jgi:hypothetical protein
VRCRLVVSGVVQAGKDAAAALAIERRPESKRRRRLGMGREDPMARQP